MHCIKTLADIRRLKLAGAISTALARHFAVRFHDLKEALAPELDAEEFSLEMHGIFGLLEAGNADLSGMGLPKDMCQVRPEWVSRLEVGSEVYFVVYLMADNDHIDIAFLPEAVMSESIREWVLEQDVEEECGEGESTL